VERVLAASAGTPVGVAAGDGGLLRRRQAGGAVEFGGIGAAVTLLRRPVRHVQVVEALEQLRGGGTERVVHRVTEPALEQERHVEAAPREVVVDAREQLGVGVPADDAVGSGDCTVAVDIAHADVAGLLAVAPGDGGSDRDNNRSLVRCRYPSTVPLMRSWNRPKSTPTSSWAVRSHTRSGLGIWPGR